MRAVYGQHLDFGAKLINTVGGRLAGPSRWIALGLGLTMFAFAGACSKDASEVSSRPTPQSQPEQSGSKPNVHPNKSRPSEVLPPRAQPRPSPPVTPVGRWPAVEHLVAIGDLHGDLQAAVRVLQLIGAIDDQRQWIGGALTIVQTGDLLDRGDDEPELMTLLARLQAEARTHGGALHLMNGNHEYMNVAGDLRYVTAKGFEQYRSYAPSADPREGRRVAFAPGSALALRFAAQPVVMVVGETAFAHGGITPTVARLGIDELNAASYRWLSGQDARPWPPLLDTEGPVWTRVYASAGEQQACALLEAALLELRVRRMVVGHTVQRGGITSRCGGKIWMIDVGMARHYGGPTQALEIRRGEARVLAGG